MCKEITRYLNYEWKATFRIQNYCKQFQEVTELFNTSIYVFKDILKYFT